MSTQQIIESWEDGVEPYNATTNEHNCLQCNKPMNPVDWIIGAVCMRCCRKNHAKVTGKRFPTS